MRPTPPGAGASSSRSPGSSATRGAIRGAQDPRRRRGGDGAVAVRGRRRGPPDLARTALRRPPRCGDAGRRVVGGGGPIPRAGLVEHHPEAAGFWPAQAVANAALGWGRSDRRHAGLHRHAALRRPRVGRVGRGRRRARRRGPAPDDRSPGRPGRDGGGRRWRGARRRHDRRLRGATGGRRRARRGRARHPRRHADRVGGRVERAPRSKGSGRSRTRRRASCSWAVPPTPAASS